MGPSASRLRLAPPVIGSTKDSTSTDRSSVERRRRLLVLLALAPSFRLAIPSASACSTIRSRRLSKKGLLCTLTGNDKSSQLSPETHDSSSMSHASSHGSGNSTSTSSYEVTMNSRSAMTNFTGCPVALSS